MFKFFHKKKMQRQAAEEKSRAFKHVLADIENGNGNRLEAALVLHLAMNDQDSLTRFLITFGGAEIWLLDKPGKRFDDPVVTEGADGKIYVAAFTSKFRATAAAEVAGEFSNYPIGISGLELVFSLDQAFGIILNSDDPHVQWGFTPEQVSNLREMFERSYKCEVGGLYSVWTGGAFRAVKLLSVDDRGIHLRIYANTFPERPEKIDPASLTMESGPGGPSSVGHVPMIRAAFLAMGPGLMATAGVTDDELEGYKIWEEARGGYFGA